MINERLFHQFIRWVILLFLVTSVILGFIWVNYLYSRFSLSNETFAEKSLERIRKEIDVKSDIIREQGDRIYDQEVLDLQEILRFRATALRNTLYDYYYLLNYEPATIEDKLAENIKVLEKETGIKAYLYKTDNSLRIGEPVEGVANPEAKKFYRVLTQLIYYEELSSLDLKIFLHVDEQRYVENNMRKNFARYLELDPSIVIFDRHRRNLDSQSSLSHQPEGNENNNYYFQLKPSEKSGFTFGYFIEKATQTKLLKDRRELFKGFMRNHIVEIFAFVMLLSITSYALFRFFRRYIDGYQTKLNDGIIEAYEQRRSLHENELFEGFGLSKSVDYIINDCNNERDRLEEEIRELKRSQKRRQVKILQLERKIQVMSQQEVEQSSKKLPAACVAVKERIAQAHEEWDQEAALTLLGDDLHMELEEQRFSDLWEQLFTLSEEPSRAYQIELLQDNGILNVYFSLAYAGDIPQDSLQKLRGTLRHMGASIVRERIGKQMAHLVLSIPSKSSTM